MSKPQSDLAINLFYSYSHRDTQHKLSMEKALALLKEDGLLVDWSDSAILPGQNISASIQDNMDKADIIVFLLSPDFIASEECRKEWNQAKRLATFKPHLFRVPVIVRNCAWENMLKGDDVLALPRDGKPVDTFERTDDAWQQVYEGIKALVNHLRNTFTLRQEFVAQMERTDFLSQENLNLTDTFVFLPLVCGAAPRAHNENLTYGTSGLGDRITDPEELLRKKYTLIHGPDKSGKSALGKYVYLTLVKESRPALYLDLNQIPQNAGQDYFRQIYQSQFNGDYSLWKLRADKTLILDNLTSRPGVVDFVVAAKETFERIIVTLSSPVFYSFFRDESRLADFEELMITELTHVLQETLIRKRCLLTTNSSLSDGKIDELEDHVNSIILDDRIVPRYPFFVLCILQTYEGYMPAGLSISSYGHCYYALIVASLVRAGVSNQDSDINACFNFTEQLAFEKYELSKGQHSPEFDIESFIQEYHNKYYIPQSTIRRLKHEEFGVIDSSGNFKSSYMHYFFLGRHLAKANDKNRAILRSMCDATHIEENYLTLLFTIHHTNDQEVIDDILLRTMVTLDDVDVARLDRTETRRFQEIVSSLPSTILSEGSVEHERKREREIRDSAAKLPIATDEMGVVDDEDGKQIQEAVNGIYRVLKNNEIMGQVLRNTYGSITRQRIEEIVEVMCDGGLKLVNLVLKDEEEILEMAHYLKAKSPDHDLNKIKEVLSWFSLVWTMVNLLHIVKSINIPEIKPSIGSLARHLQTPAYDVISYFSLLDAATELTEKERSELSRLLNRHKDPFVKGVLSLRTQHYINTHRSKTQIEQSVCSLLGIRYRPRLIQQST